MTIRSLILLVLIFGFETAFSQDNTPLQSRRDRLSYALGMDLGNQLKRQSVDIDATLFARGLREALAGAKTLLTEAEAQAIIVELQKEAMKKQQAMLEEQKKNLKASSEKNLKEGETFLAENKKKEGVVTLASGVQYKIIKAGSGKKPVADDTVTFHYKGTLLDGTEYDNSYKRNQPITVPVKGVIKGWSEALQLMPAGSIWQLFIPSSLAYREIGYGSMIGPNATLIVEVELISVNDK